MVAKKEEVREQDDQKSNGMLWLVVIIIIAFIAAWFFYQYPYKALRRIDAENTAAQEVADRSMLERIREARVRTKGCGQTEPEVRTMTVIETKSVLADVIVTNGRAFVLRWGQPEWDRYIKNHKDDADESLSKQYLALVSGPAEKMPPQTKDNAECGE